MIYRDRFGYLRQIPDAQFGDGFGDYSDAGEVIYDGFGNPLGILPFLAALAAPLAQKLIPRVAASLPGLVSSITGRRPSVPPTPEAAPPPPPPPPPAPVVSAPTTPTIIQVPVPFPMPPQQPMGPSPYPQAQQRPLRIYRRRRHLRRRAPVRLRVTEQVTVPPSSQVRFHPPGVSISPPPSPAPPAAPPVATESSGEMSGAFYGPFDNFF
jgi:hypothetical protein